MLERLLNLLAPPPLPVITPMPKHVDAVHLDPALLLLHFEEARNPKTHMGYTVPLENRK